MPLDDRRPERDPHQLLESLDLLLDDIDEVLPVDAAEFVSAYVQRGGNGGGQYIALIEAWIAALGPKRAASLFWLLTSVDDVVWTMAYPDHPAFRLLRIKFGEPAAMYWVLAISAMPDLMSHIITGVTMAGDADSDDHTESRFEPLDGSFRRPSRADRIEAELGLREAEQASDYTSARRYLERALSLTTLDDTELLDEYKHLKAASPEELERSDSDTFHLLEFHRLVKQTLCPVQSRDRVWDRVDIIETVDLGDREVEHSRQASPSVDSSSHPQQKGTSLEDATVRLLRHIFHLSAEQSVSIGAHVRKQRSGYQFGHDIQFVSSVGVNEDIRCHVECKNYTGSIRARDISDKLLQQRHAAQTGSIDHWILISPHSDPANDLAEMLRAWETDDIWPFKVHVWSPASGIKDLLATVPEVYKAIYSEDPPKVDVPSVIAEFRDRLRPFLRLHAGFQSYLREPWQLCFPMEDAAHFRALESDHAELGTVDLAGRPTGRTLQAVTREWIDEGDSHALLLLGEFGDGKSFFTYMACRSLADAFLQRPEGTPFPVRLSLRDLRRLGSHEALMDEWLKNLGVPRGEWRRLAATHPTLIVLDGFDEMTAELDPPTIEGNMRLLTDALESIAGPSTDENSKRRVLVTSRGRFFDQPREEAAIRERLGDPQVVRIRPLSRSEVLAHLSRYAQSIGAEEKLARLRLLYDPIGLASKPLFLQMIKDTLEDLPSDKFGATTLYETFIQKSLDRKSELLIGSQPQELRSEMVDRLRALLERVAVLIHNGANGQVDLRDVSRSDGEMAELLWRMSSNVEIGAAHAEADARMRVSVRSLLRPMQSDDADAWTVAFFHRSMMEYFVAVAVVSALTDDDHVRLHEILKTNPLSRETVEFVVDREPRSAERKGMCNRLESIARGAILSVNDGGALGGNALTLLCALSSGELANTAWRGLRLDYAQLTGADLRGVDLTGASLQYANLDNADLSGANLTDADLTGVRIEQTSQVEAIELEGDSGGILVAYSDGTLREWRAGATGRWTSHIVFEGMEGRVQQLVAINAGMVVVVTAGDAWLLARTSPKWSVSARLLRSPFLQDLGIGTDGRLVSWHVGERVDRVECDLGRGYVETKVWAVESEVAVALLPFVDSGGRSGGEGPRAFISADWLLSSFFVGSHLGPTLWRADGQQRWRLSEDVLPSSFDVQMSGDGMRVVVGSDDGQLLLGTMPPEGGEVELRTVCEQIHDGPITAVRWLDRATIVTGGVDRCVRVWRLGRDSVEVVALYLTLQCEGADLRGVKGPAERALLTELAQRPETPEEEYLETEPRWQGG